MRAVIIEAAISGGDKKPHSPISPEQVADDAIACLGAGAAIIHNHIENIRLAGQAAADRYAAGWRRVLVEWPDAILCPTTTIGNTDAAVRNTHQELLSGMARMGVIDPGSVNLASSDEDGLPGEHRMVYANSYDDIETIFMMLGRAHQGPSIAIYEPGWLRIVLAYYRAGRLPQGTMVKLYFGGDRNWLNGQPNGITFGLPPTAKALEAYLEMLEGTDLPWSVAVPGGDVVATGLAQWAIERGGHIRVGLEDYAGDRAPTNAQLVEEAATLIRTAGREPADSVEAARILGLPMAIQRSSSSLEPKENLNC